MRRTDGRGPQAPSGRDEVVGYVADYAMDAAEAGVEPDMIASALREAADEIEFQDRMQNIDVAENGEVAQ